MRKSTASLNIASIGVNLKRRLMMLKNSLSRRRLVFHTLSMPVLVFANWTPFGMKNESPLAVYTKQNICINESKLDEIVTKCGKSYCKQIRLTLYSARRSWKATKNLRIGGYVIDFI